MERPRPGHAAVILMNAFAAALFTILPAGCSRAPPPAPPSDPARASPDPVAPVAAEAPEPEQTAPAPLPVAAGEILEDEWMLIMIAGQPAGRLHTTVARKGESIRTEARTVIVMARAGITIRQEVWFETVETVDGKPISFTMRQKMAASDVEVTGTFEGDKLRLVSRTRGREREREIEWPKGAVFGLAMEERVRRMPREVGSRLSFLTYHPQLDSVVEITYTVGETRGVDVLGSETILTRFDVHGAGIPLVEYRDAKGTFWKSEMGGAGLAIEMLRAPREEVLARTERPSNFDALTDLAVRIHAEIESPRAVTKATYRLRLADDSLDDLELDGPGQKATREADGTVLLEVKAVRPRNSAPLGDASGLADVEKYLAPSTFAQSDDPEIVSIARSVTAGARSSLKAAKKLERWVARNVTGKNFNTGFATASEVMKNRTGDCSEHAVLLCALLRAAGVPSRGAAGLIYAELPGCGLAFGYHMWSEAWVGEWVPLDAVFPSNFVDAAHIRLGRMDLANMSPAGETMKLFRVMGQLGICLIEYTSRGRTYEVGPRTEFKGGRYRDLDEGVSFVPPGGWGLVRAGDSRLDDRGAVAALVERGGEGRIVLISTPTGGSGLDEIVDRMGKRNTITRRRAATLAGVAAVRVSYESGGERREGVAATRGGRFYLLRLGPATAGGVRALDAVARSFRFE